MKVLCLLLSIALARPTSKLVRTKDDGSLSYSSPPPSNNTFGLTFNQFSTAVTSNGYPVPSQEQFQNLVSRANNGNIGTKLELAMFLAQLLHESGGLVYKSEIGCPQQSKCSQYQPATWDPQTCGRNLNSPCRKAGATGEKYYGRGYMQLSWPVNYEAASWMLYGDDRLYLNPDLVSSKDETAWDTAFWYWKVAVRIDSRVLQGQFGVSTSRINGALECTGPNQNLARQRFNIYTKVFQSFDLSGSPNPAGCY